MISHRTARELLPTAVSEVLDEFRRGASLDFHLWRANARTPALHLYPRDDGGDAPHPDSILLPITTGKGPGLTLELRGRFSREMTPAVSALRTALEHLYRYSEEVQAFTSEVSERYEEINLLYSISETLGSLLPLRDAARLILAEVCDVMGARRGSLWVADPGDDQLRLVASVGEEGLEGPLQIGDATAVTAKVFREGRAVILSENQIGNTQLRPFEAERLREDEDSVLSVPIRYSPPEGKPRTVGVINLIGRRRGGPFTGSDQRLLGAIASQVGAALENNRLVQESLQRERVSREMELAHDLQMKLLPAAETFDPDRVAARVEPTDSVGGDFYHFFRVRGGRFGVMIGDVSSHGFPAALIMALSMSAATIYASEVSSPARVLEAMGQALMDELETTEMYLTLFYGVVDPERGELVYANAGHPHAFVIRGDGRTDRLEAMQPPMGIAGAGEYHQRVVPWTIGEDLLLLFTDGLSDDVVASSRTAGEQRVLDETVRLRDRPVDEIVEALFALQCGARESAGQGDDRTAVVFRV